jgi:UPF0716 protein FxsA
MTSTRLVFRVRDRDFAFRLILALVCYSLVPLAEIFLLVYLGNLLGAFPVLAAVALAAMAGVLTARPQLRGLAASLRGWRRHGERPEAELIEIAGLAAASLLLLTPGFITDLAGFLLLVPRIRRAAGAAALRLLGRRAREVAAALLPPGP